MNLLVRFLKTIFLVNRPNYRQVLECASPSAFAAGQSAAPARRRLALWTVPGRAKAVEGHRTPGRYRDSISFLWIGIARREVFFRKVLTLAVAAVMVTPAPLLACAACTGKSDSSLAVGMNWGIFTLLGVVLSVLSCFVVFFVHVARRSPPDEGDANPPRPSE
jgi:hypothetical protein